MRPRHAIAVSLISATTIVVFKWGADVFSDGGGAAVRVRRGELRGAMGDQSRRPGPRSSEYDGVAGVGTAGYGGMIGAGPADFVDAARIVIPATVHVVAHGRLGEYVSGSGAIISDDGYIVTNNHVIDGAKTIQVTLNNRQTLAARVVGTDANTDVAVLKVEGANLPFLVYGNSDEVRVGQWVLAVGYPLSLQVTATAGIVSGMERDLGRDPGQNLNRTDSFIQTDAAVNLGNSGGPLVNPEGQIIGINTAMATPNGAYTGYSFAIPVNVVRRVVSELIAHGAVRKG